MAASSSSSSNSFLQLPLSIIAIIATLQLICLVQARPPNNIIMTSSPLITYVSSPAPFTHTEFAIFSTPNLYHAPSHPHSSSPPPHHHHFMRKQQLHSPQAVVTGHVFCDVCKNGNIKEPLKGVTIGVTCWNGKEEQFFYGITNKSGKFNVKLSGYNLQKHGGDKSCHAKLIYPSFRSSCMVPTNLHDGKLGAPLHVMSESPKKVVLFAGPFSYTTRFKDKKCHQKYENHTRTHKHKRSSSHFDEQSRHVHKNQDGPSCPINECKHNILPSSYNIQSTFFETN
ncbi:hypothetical protein L7F22_018245 [Adiantum nelumboides]|nr:hypothetical protein [Adiantum nelumboides]MCO5564581.1 hypothetical protein [Adiantum nelumboides]